MSHTASNDTQRNENCPEAQRHAYNAAFEALGLGWHWDTATYQTHAGQGARGVRGYLEAQHPHLLRAYEADFLVQAIEDAKARCHAGTTRIPMPAPAPAGRTSRRVQQAA